MDLMLGEPPETVHPVVLMGRYVGLLADNAPEPRTAQLAWGAGSVLLVGGLSYGFGRFAERRSGGLAGLVAEAYLLKTCFAYRALEGAALGVVASLEAGQTEEARDALRSLVGRDRSKLDGTGISAAVIESLGENLSDSFTAPLLAYAGGGLPAAFAYRAANTADAMIGYRGRYEYTGKFAAGADDLLNLIPARITGAAVCLASGRAAAEGVRTMVRDRHITESPNAGWPMSAVAGALGVALAKPGFYRINAGAREPDAGDARRAVALVRRSAVLCAGLAFVTALLRETR